MLPPPKVYGDSDMDEDEKLDDNDWQQRGSYQKKQRGIKKMSWCYYMRSTRPLVSPIDLKVWRMIVNHT